MMGSHTMEWNQMQCDGEEKGGRVEGWKGGGDKTTGAVRIRTHHSSVVEVVGGATEEEGKQHEHESC